VIQTALGACCDEVMMLSVFDHRTFLFSLCFWLGSAVSSDSLVAAEVVGSGVARELTIAFRQGVDGYRGTVDTEMWALAANTILEANGNASSDANNDGGESQVLMRFDGIIGADRGQIPKFSRIVSARLEVSAFDQGTTVNIHRMLIPFSESATWNSMIAGVSADGQEASRRKDSFTFGTIAANSSTAVFDVTDTLQAWVNGRPNYGWVFINTGGNGWDFYTSDFQDVKQRPKLIVVYQVPAVD